MKTLTKTATDTDPKEALFNAAKVLFAECGFEGVSVRAIAAEAGVHFGLIRYYYGGKSDLYLACLRRYGERRLACADELQKPAKTLAEFTDKLRQAMSSVLLVQMEDPYLTKIFLHEVERETSLADSVLGETVISMAKRFIAYFAAAQEKGWIRPDVDPQILTHVIHGTINHFVRTDAVRGRHFGFSVKDGLSREHLVENMLRLILSGVLSTTT